MPTRSSKSSHMSSFYKNISWRFGRLRHLVVTMLPFLLIIASFDTSKALDDDSDHPLAKIDIVKTQFAFNRDTFIRAFPPVLGLRGHNTEWVTLVYSTPNPSIDDWIGVFSPFNISTSTCPGENTNPPLLCSAPIKYQYANYSNPNYLTTARGTMNLQLINQRSDFSFALFSGGLSQPKLVALSERVIFANPRAPLYPRLSQGKEWDIMVVKWTSGYSVEEAEPFVEWGLRGGPRSRSSAETVNFDRGSMCGAPAKTVGWRDPGFVHTSFMKELWPSRWYVYRLGHRLPNSQYVWSREYDFRAPPPRGQDSLQRVAVFGDMGKFEADGSNENNSYQPGAQNTTRQLIYDLENIDMVFHLGGISYARGYISQWDQFTSQIEPIASTVPYMIASGETERDWPGTGSFYGRGDSGGECGVLAENMFYVPAENDAKFWYSADYGMFHFCVANTDYDWREGSEQHRFLEHCFASVNRQRQPWLVFLAHRVLGYSSSRFYAKEGSVGEPLGRDSIHNLLHKYKVDVAIYGHVHSYERTCPIHQSNCTRNETSHYQGSLNGTIHVVAGGGGANLSEFNTNGTQWSVFRDYDYGFVKLTSINRSELLFEYKKSSDGGVYDWFRLSREYMDIISQI